MTEITVKGLGGCINFEMRLLQEALEAAGFTVTVENDAADWVVSKDPDWYKRVHDSDKTYNPIKLKANHLPWGG